MEDHYKIEARKSHTIEQTILIVLLAFYFLCPTSLGPHCYFSGENSPWARFYPHFFLEIP